MNFYNPGFNFPYSSAMLSSRGAGGIFGRLLSGFKGANWTSIFSGIQKTLGLVNQAIPVFKQINPMIKNAKTMFKVMGELNKSDNKDTKDNINTTNIKDTTNIKVNKETINENSIKKTAEVKATSTVSQSELNSSTASNNMGGPTFFL